MLRPCRFFLVSIELAGIRWTGRAERAGSEIVVCSVWGGARAELGRRKAQRLAQDLLIEILQRKLAALEAAAA